MAAVPYIVYPFTGSFPDRRGVRCMHHKNPQQLQQCTSGFVFWLFQQLEALWAMPRVHAGRRCYIEDSRALYTTNSTTKLFTPRLYRCRGCGFGNCKMSRARRGPHPHQAPMWCQSHSAWRRWERRLPRSPSASSGCPLHSWSQLETDMVWWLKTMRSY